MSKKVIGIAVIAGLDLAFIILMQGRWDFSEVSQHIEPTDRYERYLTQRQSMPELEINDQAEEPERLATPSSTARIERPRSVRNATHIPKKRTKRSRPSGEPAATAKFTDTIIYVKRSEPFEFQQVSLIEPQLPASEPVLEIQPEPKKKSFFARAAPIIKKPYEWVKDLAEKLK